MLHYFPALYHFTFLLAMDESSSCFPSLIIHGMVTLFNFRHSNGWVVVYLIAVLIHFLLWHYIWHFLMCFLAICTFFGEMTIQIYSYFFNLVVCFLIGFWVSFFNSWYKSFIRYVTCKYVLPVCGLLILLTVSFKEQKYLI